MPLYRPNVALILRNPAGEILLCERNDYAGSWQFPQGGLKADENPLKGLRREVKEELDLPPSAYQVLARKGPYRYLFPEGRKKKGYDGQEQTYFLAQLTDETAEMRFKGKPPEFRAARWLAPWDFDLASTAEMRRNVYRDVFRDFFGINFPEPALSKSY